MNPPVRVILSAIVIQLVTLFLVACATTQKAAPTTTVLPHFTVLAVIAWVGDNGGIHAHQIGYAQSLDDCHKLIEHTLSQAQQAKGEHPAVSCLDIGAAASGVHDEKMKPPGSVDL